MASISNLPSDMEGIAFCSPGTTSELLPFCEISTLILCWLSVLGVLFGVLLLSLLPNTASLVDYGNVVLDELHLVSFVRYIAAVEHSILVLMNTCSLWCIIFLVSSVTARVCFIMPFMVFFLGCQVFGPLSIVVALHFSRWKFVWYLARLFGSIVHGVNKLVYAWRGWEVVP